MRRVRAAALGAAACLLLGACGSGSEGGGSDEPRAPIFRTPVSLAPATPPPSRAPGTPPPRLGTPPPRLGTPPPRVGTPPDRTAGPAKPVTISGTVAEGVEAGCLILDGYLLIGGRDQGVRAGAKVTVTGRAQPDVLTSCQQGTPLLVEKVTAR